MKQRILDRAKDIIQDNEIHRTVTTNCCFSVLTIGFKVFINSDRDVVLYYRQEKLLSLGKDDPERDDFLVHLFEHYETQTKKKTEENLSQFFNTGVRNGKTTNYISEFLDNGRMLNSTKN